MFAELVCSAISSTIENNTDLNNSFVVDSDSDWSYLFMPDPIAGDTTDVGSLYSDD